MAKFCKNCGAYITDADQICPDCGREIQKSKTKTKFCHKCGERISGNEYFCKNCGIRLKKREKEKTSFLDKHKTLVMTVAIIAAIVIVSIGAFSMLVPSTTQEVEVDTFNFNIPYDFTENEDSSIDENDDGLIYVSKYWENGEDAISIDVTYAQSENFDAEGFSAELGGDYQNMMGYDGYYSEDFGTYSFTFVKDNKVIIIYTTNPALFDEIEIL